MPAGKLVSPFTQGVFEKLVAYITVKGPASYPSGGFEVEVSEVRTLDNFDVVVISNPTQLLEQDNLVYSVSWTKSGNKVKIVVKTLNVTAASPVSWTEISPGTDLSAVDFTVLVFQKQ